METLKIKYFDKDITKLEKISKGDWIDLRSAVTIELEPNAHYLIPLGIGVKLPEGYEAIVAPRSSSFKNWGILQTNSPGVIDNSYSGEKDEWKMTVYATRKSIINKNDRIAHFRIQKIQPELELVEVDFLDDVSRGGFGSTGTN
jgi:dUTP pyrophosphatase